MRSFTMVSTNSISCWIPIVRKWSKSDKYFFCTSWSNSGFWFCFFFLTSKLNGIETNFFFHVPEEEGETYLIWIEILINVQVTTKKIDLDSKEESQHANGIHRHCDFGKGLCFQGLPRCHLALRGLRVRRSKFTWICHHQQLVYLLF